LLARLSRSAGVTLTGGAGFALFVQWSHQHWWVGPLMFGLLALVLLGLSRW
jgi:hypothetical protein